MTTQRAGATCKAETDLLSATNSIGTLILDLQPPELGENKLLLSEPSRMCYFVRHPKQTNKLCEPIVLLMSAGE